MSTCTATCHGFRSVRVECARNPCLAVDQMCSLWYNVSATNCESWCCENRVGYVFFMVIFFSLGTFAICAAYYLHRLHQINVVSGAVNEDGTMIDPIQPAEESVETKRIKRVVEVDDKLGRSLDFGS